MECVCIIYTIFFIVKKKKNKKFLKAFVDIVAFVDVVIVFLFFTTKYRIIMENKNDAECLQ